MQYTLMFYIIKRESQITIVLQTCKSFFSLFFLSHRLVRNIISNALESLFDFVNISRF